MAPISPNTMDMATAALALGSCLERLFFSLFLDSSWYVDICVLIFPTEVNNGDLVPRSMHTWQ